VFIAVQNMRRFGAAVTKSGRAFQAGAYATGNARSPSVVSVAPVAWTTATHCSTASLTS